MKENSVQGCHLSKKLEEVRIGLLDVPFSWTLLMVFEDEFKGMLAVFCPVLSATLSWLLSSAAEYLVVSAVSFFSAPGKA